jgi:hypothetical protein
MKRFAYTFTFIPYTAEPGNFMFYFGTTDWVDDKPIEHTQLADVKICNVPEAASMAEVMEYAVSMVDIAYAETCQAYAKSKAPTITETNARPGDSSVPS